MYAQRLYESIRSDIVYNRKDGKLKRPSIEGCLNKLYVIVK